MKPYVAFSRAAGSEEGAILVIAHTSREAKKLAWQSGEVWNIDGWIDLAVKLIIEDHNSMPLADQEKIKGDIAHVVSEPVACENCELWGVGLDRDDMCSRCGDPPGERLIKAIAKSEVDGQ